MAINQNIVNWFEIPVNDLQRAKSFYESVFDVELTIGEMEGTKMAWFPMVQDAPGSGGTLIQGEGYSPSNSGVMIYLSVDDIENTLSLIEKNNGKVLLGKTSIGEHGFFAQFEDTEGNRLSLHSY